MKRQSGERVTEHVKDRFPSIFRTWGVDAKRWPGGITEFAHQAGRNPVVMMHRINRNNRDHVPTLEDLLVTLETMQPEGLVNALALLAGRVTVQLPDVPREPREVLSSFLALAQRAGEVTSRGAVAIADLHLSAVERAELAPLVDELMTVAVEFAAVLRGG